MDEGFESILTSKETRKYGAWCFGQLAVTPNNLTTNLPNLTLTKD
jgi:hypothetical protein